MWNPFKNKEEKRSLLGDISDSIANNISLSYNTSGATNFSTDRALTLSTVYRCVEVISDAIAQLPMEVFNTDTQGFRQINIKHPVHYLINKEPNSVMTRFTFMKCMVSHMLLCGNAYALIVRDGLNVKELKLLDPTKVTVHYDSNWENLYYTISGNKEKIEPINMIHLTNYTYNGIVGVSTLTYAKNSLGISLDSENHARGFFKGGANIAGILKVNGTITDKQKEDIKSSWMQSFNATNGNPNGVAVMQGNMDFIKVSVSPAEAQMIETRQFNVVDICRFFGVSPIKAFDLSAANYSTVEATQLAFLTDTLAPILEKIELELERKLFRPSEKQIMDIRFNTSQLLKADKTSQAEYYNKLFNMGAITPNEVRREVNLSPINGGDNTYVQVNMQQLKAFNDLSDSVKH